MKSQLEGGVKLEIEKEYYSFALAQRVLTVAVVSLDETGVMIDWTAYIDSVKGQNHDLEKQAVADVGDKLIKELACKIFYYLPEDKFRK